VPAAVLSSKPDLATVRDALLARCPDLTSLWLDDPALLLRWRRSRDGTVTESTASNADAGEYIHARHWSIRIAELCSI
jgi:hypothetical protein